MYLVLILEDVHSPHRNSKTQRGLRVDFKNNFKILKKYFFTRCVCLLQRNLYDLSLVTFLIKKFCFYIIRMFCFPDDTLDIYGIVWEFKIVIGPIISFSERKKKQNKTKQKSSWVSCYWFYCLSSIRTYSNTALHFNLSISGYWFCKMEWDAFSSIALN